MAKYLHDLKDWPAFHWDRQALAERLIAVRHRQGRLIGRMEGLGFALRAEATLRTLTEDVLKSSEIEGEMLDREQVRSSIARRLGMDIGALTPADRDVEGVVEMMLDATQKFAEPLTKERLFGWHAALFPTGRSGITRIVVGAWRDDRMGPMQVVSGSIGDEKIHYQAPAAERLDKEMRAFLAWFNAADPIDPVVKAGLAHLWFVTIHPFDDGNGRIGPLGTKRAAILQHVFADTKRAQGLLRLARNDAKRRSRNHAVARMVSRLPRPRVRHRRGHPWRGAAQGPLLGKMGGHVTE